jgi:hypothetical protein
MSRIQNFFEIGLLCRCNIKENYTKPPILRNKTLIAPSPIILSIIEKYTTISSQYCWVEVTYSLAIFAYKLIRQGLAVLRMYMVYHFF